MIRPIRDAHVRLPPLLPSDSLAALCSETAAIEKVQPEAVEKDYYLTRLIWALAQLRGDRLLLKGGTCLSKVDLGYHRMSEDVDLVIPWAGSLRYGATNASEMKPVREALRTIADPVGVRLPSPGGEDSERGSHIIWEVIYASELVPQDLAVITVEVSMQRVLRPGRQAPLKQLLPADLAPGYADAYCWALDAAEARAEKVRAAFDREAIRDFYDLGLFLRVDADVSSPEFIALVNEKLQEVNREVLAAQPAAFNLTPARRAGLTLDAKSLAAVVRLGDAPFDLDAVAARYDTLWGKRA